MASSNIATGPVGMVEKEPSIYHLDEVDDSRKEVQVDRFGSAAKTDPKEIALVRKLDLYLMVCMPFSLRAYRAQSKFLSSLTSGSFTFLIFSAETHSSVES